MGSAAYMHKYMCVKERAIEKKKKNRHIHVYVYTQQNLLLLAVPYAGATYTHTHTLNENVFCLLRKNYQNNFPDGQITQNQSFIFNNYIHLGVC